MADSTTILFAGGGTGGHLYPGLAVAESLRRAHPEVQCLFLCTTREIDRIILEPTGFEFIPQPVVPPSSSVGGLLKFWSKWRETSDLVKRVIRERKPRAVLGLGGYAAGAAVRRAAHKHIPTAVVNPDVIPGRANRLLMRYTDAVCCQFIETENHVSGHHRNKLLITGCPIRSQISKTPNKPEALARLGLDPMLATLVVTGASLGAQTINEAVLTLMKDITLSGWQILHLSGSDHAATVREGYRDVKVPARVIDFTPAMADVWAVADLAISRSGASSCAELTVTGTPAILMPYPYHKDLHQRANARVLADAGAAVLIDDDKDRKKNAAKLRPVLESLLHDANKRAAMSESARSIGRPDAADAVAAVLMGMVATGT